MLRVNIFLILVFAAGLGCRGFCDVAGTQEKSDWLVSPKLLLQSGLAGQWQLTVPLKQQKNEQIDRILVFGDYLYVLTDQNYLYCINRAKGTVRFVLQLAVAGLPVCQPQYYQNKLWFMVGNKLLVLDPESGVLSTTERLGMIGTSAACSVARNSTHLFIAGADKRLHAIVADEYWQQFMVTADDDSPITSVIADDDFVIFSTLSGNVVSISSESPKRLWQFDVGGAITAPIVRDGNRLYVGSEDTKLYKFNIHTGRSLWTAPFQAGAALKTAAVTGAEVVYQYAGQQGLYAVDKQNGRKLWHVPDGVGFLAEKGSLAYVLAQPAVLVVMDNKKGKKLYSVNFAAISNYVINTIDAKIYVADDRGRLMCIAAENADSTVESKNN